MTASCYVVLELIGLGSICLLGRTLPQEQVNELLNGMRHAYVLIGLNLHCFSQVSKEEETSEEDTSDATNEQSAEEDTAPTRPHVPVPEGRKRWVKF